VFFIYDGGYLDSMMGGMSMPTLGQISDDVIMSQYPDAESLRVAVDNGTVNYDKLSSVAQGIVDEHREANPIFVTTEPEPVVVQPEVPVQPEGITVEPVVIEVEPVLIEQP
jgi:hypothetical protein